MPWLAPDKLNARLKSVAKSRDELRSAQRAEFAFTLRQLGVDRIPVNFLNPLPGTPMEGRSRLEPLEALHIIAALRVALPEQERPSWRGTWLMSWIVHWW